MCVHVLEYVIYLFICILFIYFFTINNIQNNNTLRICGGFCKHVHLARTTPPLHTTKAFQIFDEDVRKCFVQCTAVDTSDHAWHQARLTLSRGGLGLRSLTQHSPAAYIASLCTSGFGPQPLAVCFLPSCRFVAVCYSFRGSWTPS